MPRVHRRKEKNLNKSKCSVASTGGGGGSNKANQRLKKILNPDDQADEPPGSPSHWRSVKKVMAKNTKANEDEDSQKRLALMRDARQAKKAGLKTPAAAEEPDDLPDIGQKKVGKRLHDALPLIPKHMKKSLVGGKEHANADKDFYKAFKYIYVDIPEAEEDLASE
jgi:hypothetical protein